MANPTNVPAPAFTATGLTVPSQPALLAGVQADLNAAFGGNLNPALNTGQGQWAQTESAIIAGNNAALSSLVNGVDPATSTGFMQDALGRIYFMERNPGLSTVVTVTVIGLPNTVIPIGALGSDTSGNLYACTASVIIPISGTATTTFANTVLGPIACPANTLTTIYQAIPGWDTINNAGAGVIGANVETSAAFEYRRQQSVAGNSQGGTAAVYGAVFGVPGVIDCYVIENGTSAAVSVGSTSYSVAANSIYVAVVGGVSTAIAQAIAAKKSPGCNTNGNTSVTVTDPAYSYPQPSYSIKYNNPTAVPIYFYVKMNTLTGLPSNYASLIQNAIIAQFTGSNGGLRARIGMLLTTPPYVGSVLALGSTIQSLFESIYIGTSANPTSANVNVQMGIDQTPTIAASQIAIGT